MRPSWTILPVVGVLGVIVTLIMVAVRPGIACPAVGYAYVGDVELEFSTEPDTVAACFGSECSPQSVMRSTDGKWAVPQSPPYLPQEPVHPGGQMPGNLTSIRVATVQHSDPALVRVLAIHSEPAEEGRFWSACPGPSRYMPVQVP